MNVFHKLLGLLFFVLGVWSARQNRERLAHRLPFVLIVLVESALSFFLLAFSVKDEADLVIYYVAFSTFLFLAPQAVPYVVSLFTEKPPPPPEVVPPPQPPKVEEPPPEFIVPEKTRFMHTLVLGGTGSGKTSLLSEKLAEDIYKPCSLVVFDSQGDIIERLLRVDLPKDRIALIDVTDVDHPPALSLFRIGKQDYETRYEQERHLNATLELITYVLDYMGASLTSKQEVALRFLIRLCVEIEDSNIHTLRELLTDGLKNYQHFVDRLPETPKSFFQTEFNSRQFAETREQLLRRVYGICEQPQLERMFSFGKSRLDMKSLLDEGSILLINTDKSFLKEAGSAFITRFFMAVLANAIGERIPSSEAMPVFIYLDEAAPILQNDKGVITNLLETARKYNCGLTLSFQSLSQIPTDVQQSVIANTATKCASTISAKDARALAGDMGTDDSMLMACKPLTFYESVKGVGSRIVKITPGALDRLPKRKDLRDVIELNRKKFSGIPPKRTPPDDIEAFNRRT